MDMRSLCEERGGRMRCILFKPALNQGCSASRLVRKLFLNLTDLAVVEAEIGSPISFVYTGH